MEIDYSQDIVNLNMKIIVTIVRLQDFTMVCTCLQSGNMDGGNEMMLFYASFVHIV